jgi:exodeoxyribonuclease V alpha subunit
MTTSRTDPAQDRAREPPLAATIEPAPARAATAVAGSRSARADQALADGFARHVVQWARERGAPVAAQDALRAAARATSLATAAGHVCTHLADIAATLAAAGGPADLPVLRDALLGSGLVGTPEAPATQPLILDADDRLYLHRYFDYECRLARRLLAAPPRAPEAAGANVAALLAELFAANAARMGERPDWQKIATALALTRPLTIVSGGPGTGKTPTVVNVLGCALARDPACRIRLAAPTGKAAARMLEAMRRAAIRLPAGLRERLPTESFTVHRLLGVSGETGEFRHHAGNPLPLDLLVVDEASMLDLALATRLLEAVPPSAQIILLGDKDQLAAVESGAVFAELSADPTLTGACVDRLSALTGIAAARIVPGAPLKHTGLADSVVWLTENFRFARDSGIGRLAALVNAGDGPAAVDLLRTGGDAAISWIEAAGAEPDAATRQRILDGFAPYIEAARADMANRAALFAALERFRVLCAEREGPRGVVGINARVERHVRASLAHRLDPGARSEWYPGRPVMVLANDYTLKLFNGDIGIVLPATTEGNAADTLMVCFPESDGGFRAVAPLRLPPHETAFATTVHKAQGSEFDQVLLLLPALPSRVVTRELVYTAITRARSGAAIVAGEAVLAQAIASPTRRQSGLVARLAAAAAATSAGRGRSSQNGPAELT